MNRQAFRSVCSRTRPELEQTGVSLSNYFRQFSTTPSQWAENDGSDAPKPTPSVRKRSVAAAAEINSLVNNRAPTPAAARPQQLGGASGNLPRVIDVKSLPRGRGGFRGRGGLARGGARGGARSGSEPATGTSRFSRGGGASGGRGGAFTSRGGRGGRGGRGARGGRGRGGKSGDRRAEDGDKKKERDNQGHEPMDPASQEFEHLIRFGATSEYNPSLTMETLAEFMPSFPTTPGGQAATVIENLSVLGSAERVGASLGLLDSTHAKHVRDKGLRFFADVKTREDVEAHMQEKRRTDLAARAAAKAAQGTEAGAAPVADKAPEEPKQMIKDAEESIRKVIVDRALAGVHETPKFAADPVGVARSWHLRDGSYTQKDVDSFERKLASMLGGAKGANKAQAKAQPRA